MKDTPSARIQADTQPPRYREAGKVRYTEVRRAISPVAKDRKRETG